MIFLSSAYLTELAVLAYAALGKARDLDGFAASVAGYRILPESLTPAVARLVVAAELASVLLLAMPFTRFWGAMLATVLFAAFVIAMASALRRGLRVDCGCFSPALADPIGPGTLVRTGLLLALAVMALAAARDPFQLADLLVATLMLVLVVMVSELVKLLTGPIGRSA
jgi:hypothetical protein